MTSLFVSQIHQGFPASDCGTHGLTLTGVQTGDLIVVHTSSLNALISNVVDSQGNNFIHDADAIGGGANTKNTSVWHAFAKSNTDDAIVVTWSSPCNYRELVIDQFRGISSVVSHASQGGSVGTNPFVTHTTTTGNALLVILTDNINCTQPLPFAMTEDYYLSDTLAWQIDEYIGVNPGQHTLAFIGNSTADNWAVVSLEVVTASLTRQIKDMETITPGDYNSGINNESALGLSNTITPTLRGWDATRSAVEIVFVLGLVNLGTSSDEDITINLYRVSGGVAPSQGSVAPFPGTLIASYVRVVRINPSVNANDLDGYFMDIVAQGQQWTYYLTITSPSDRVMVHASPATSLMTTKDLA